MRVLMTVGLAAILAAGVSGQGAVALNVGDMAPDFALQGTDGKLHRLSDYRGKQAVVVAWFPRAFTQGCTIECKSLAENGDKIQRFDVTYFMASVDPLEQNIKFAKATSVTLGDRVVEKKEADFPMLSDPTKEVATKYGVPAPPTAGRSTSIGRAGLPRSTRWCVRKPRRRTCSRGLPRSRSPGGSVSPGVDRPGPAQGPDDPHQLDRLSVEPLSPAPVLHVLEVVSSGFALRVDH
jgi:peroxiredoxin Q/BCP